jgi:hypothetical protein
MATRLKPIGHEDRLSIVEHLDELRTRVIICVAVFVVAFGICLWQEDFILRTVNDPLAEVANKKPCDETRDPLEQADCWQQAQKRVNEQIAATARSLAASAGNDAALRQQADALARAAAEAAAVTPRGSPKLPVTLGVGEPLTATLIAAGYAALLLTLPLLAFEVAAGAVVWPDGRGLAILLFVALFPSLLSQIFFMRGVELIGPGRAGLFVNLVPVFGALLAVVVLGEPFRPYHALALLLVLGGIWLAERGRAQ